MDLPTLWTSFISTSSPLLPPAVWVRWSLPLFWAVVLVFAVLYATKSLARPRGKFIALAVVSWAFVPGSWSPVYWLGLAFQLPSLMTVGLCTIALASRWRGSVRRPDDGGIAALQWLGILLGWLLLLDTFLVLPFVAYRWGYSPAMLALIVVVAVGLWVFAQREAARGAKLLLIALAVFVATRLPSGNVFDAVIDPWLWFALHISAFKRWRARRRSPAL